MAAIIKGTTPTIIYTFNEISVSNITAAVLTIKVGSSIIIEKNLAAATVGNKSLSWKLSQEESLAASGNAEMMLNWVLGDGTRGASKTTSVTFAPNHKEEVI